MLVVTTERGEHVLAPKRGGGVRWEEMGELAKTGRSRNAHRVAEASVCRMETLEKGRKAQRRHDTDGKQVLLYAGAECMGFVWSPAWPWPRALNVALPHETCDVVVDEGVI